jgi:hypothetical protein
MKSSDKPFLHSYSKNMKPGDLVWWVEWDKNGDHKYISNKYRGALIDFEIALPIGGERPVVYAIVLPYGSSKTRKIEPHLLKKDTN